MTQSAQRKACCVWERTFSTGLGARVMANMTGFPLKGVPEGRGIKPAMCVGSDDVSLELLASMILLCLSIARASSALR